MSINVKVPVAISSGVDFNLQVGAIPRGDFKVTVAVGNKNESFGLKRGSSISLPKAPVQEISIDGTANWTVTELSVPAGANDFTVTVTETGTGKRSGSDSGKVA